MISEGRYKSVIESAWVEVSEDGDLIMCFKTPVETADGLEHVHPRQFTNGKSLKHAQRVAEHLGISWPGGLADVASCVGREIEVSVKHNTKEGRVYVNAYIVTGPTAEPATPAQIAAGVAKLEAAAGADSDLPF